MKQVPSIAALALCTLLAAGCVRTSTHKKIVEEAAALSSNLATLSDEHQQLQIKEAACSKNLANCEDRRAETQKQLEEKQIALERAQSDIVRIEKVLSDRNQEAGKTMTQMRQEIDRLTALRKLQDEELKMIKGELAQLIADRDRLAQEKDNRDKELRAVQMTYDELIDKMQTEIARGEVTISELQGKLTVNMVEKILFNSGSAEINDNGKEILRKVGTILNDIKDKEIRVEGYSDNLPISPRLQSIYPSNWELSSARAISVVHFLRNSLNIPGERLSASSFAEFRPIADNSTPEGRALNRRIQIILAPLEAEIAK